MRAGGAPGTAGDDWPQEGLELRGRPQVRGTQSFVYTMSWCWKHPSVLALEVLWRWVFGSVALGLIWVYGRRIAGAATGGSFGLARLGLDRLTVTDPMGSASHLATAVGVVAPLSVPVLRWLVPLLLALWIAVSALGRTLVLRRVDASLATRPGTLMCLQLVRAVVLGTSFAVWFRLMVWAGKTAITGPLDGGGEANVLLYFVIVILGTLGLFTLWAVVSWWLAIAPLVAVLRGLGPVESLRAAFRVGPLRMKLVEVNLVMGIVKIALIVLAMVFSATPLPFESVTTPGFLLNWWIGVTLLYLIGSDFFHVVRLVAYLRLWRAYETATPVAETAGGAGRAPV